MSGANHPRICFIGFGEAAQAFAAGLSEAGVRSIAAYDIRRNDPGIMKAAERIGVRLTEATADAMEGSDFVFSLVTATSSIEAALSAAPHLGVHQIFVDANSVSPGRKQEASQRLGKPSSYIDLAIMAPVHPDRHRTPCLVAGERAEQLIAAFTPLEMTLLAVGPNIGAATVVKMVRSVMVKGLEALTYECFMAARAAKIDSVILASLAKSYPGMDWPVSGAYNLNRMLQHGVRRAAEMREVAATLEELGVAPHMTSAAVLHQESLGSLDLSLEPGWLGDMLDNVRARLEATGANPGIFMTSETSKVHTNE